MNALTLAIVCRSKSLSNLVADLGDSTRPAPEVLQKRSMRYASMVCRGVQATSSVHSTGSMVIKL